MADLSAANTKIRVTAEDLTERADETEQEIKDIENSLKEIRRAVNATKSYWTGEAGDASRQRCESRLEELEGLIKRLKDQPKTLLSIANVYKETEEEAKSAAGPLPANVID